MKKAFALLVCLIVLLCSCTPRKEPQSTETPDAPAITPESRSDEVDLHSIREHIQNICVYPRKAGSDGERAAARYISDEFRNYGYTPQIAEFSYESKRTQKLPDLCRLTIPQEDMVIPECYCIKYSANGAAEGPVVLFENTKTECSGALALIPWREDLQDLILAASEKGASGILLYAETEDVEYDPLPWECVDRTTGIPMAGIPLSDARTLLKIIRKKDVSARLEVQGARWATTSQNVIAIQKADAAEPEILIIGAHYDSFAGLPAACDNASGVAVLLEVSRLLKNIRGDTEIHFVAFGADEEGMAGASKYADSLSEAQRKRVTGMIDLESPGSGELSIGYPKVNESWIGEALRTAIEKIQAAPVRALPDDRGGHASFYKDGMDAVMIYGEDGSDACKTARDRIANLDNKSLSDSAQAVVSTALRIADPGSKTINDPNKARISSRKLAASDAEIKNEAMLFLGDDRYHMQKRLGITGLPYEEDTVPGSFIYKLKWFGMENAVNSVFHFGEDGCLVDVEILMQDAGYTFADIYRSMHKSLGKPDDTYTEKDYEEYCWNGIYGRMHMLEKERDGYRVCIYETYKEEKIIRQFTVKNGKIAFPAKDAAYKKIWDLASSIMLPQYREAISKFTLFTDGVSGKLAEVEFLDGKKTKYNLGLDYWDVYDEKGNFRNEKTLMETIAHEYGHIITISNEQVDLYQVPYKEVFADIGTYKKGSYLQDFYDAFYNRLEKDAKSMDFDEFYATYIDQFPTRYASYSPSEDLAECFAFFATGETDVLPPPKLSFLLKYPELVRARDFVLAALGH